MIRSMPGCGQACRWKQEWTPGAARSQGRFDETIATVDVAARHACRLRADPAPFPAGLHNHAIPRLADRPDGHGADRHCRVEAIWRPGPFGADSSDARSVGKEGVSTRKSR